MAPRPARLVTRARSVTHAKSGGRKIRRLPDTQEKPVHARSRVEVDCVVLCFIRGHTLNAGGLECFAKAPGLNP